jgi:hypothetical protein
MPSDIGLKMGLRNLKRKWNVQGTSAINGTGLTEGLDWLAKTLDN